MCAYNVSGHGIGCQAIHTPYTMYICDPFWENLPKHAETTIEI